MFSEKVFATQKRLNEEIQTSNISDSESDETFQFQEIFDRFKFPNRNFGDYDRSWGTYAIETNPWEDSKRPYYNLLNKDSLELNSKEREGILTKRLIAACSSYLDKSPISQQYVLCKCDLSKCNLKNIDLLKYYHRFQYLDLSHNSLVDVTALRNSAMLMYLDVSHNMLPEVLNFRAPLNLTFVNFSHNCIKQINNLTSFWSIVKLNLSNNGIREIEGLDTLKHLQMLDLSYNEIECINNIGNLRNLMSLNLSRNNIRRIGCSISGLQQLRYVNFNHNKLKSLKWFKSKSLVIKQIMISNNLIENILQLTNLENLNHLLELDIRENEIIKFPKFFSVCLNCLRCLKKLNGSFVCSEDRLLNNYEFAPLSKVSLRRKQNMIILLNQMRTTKIICDYILPVNVPPPPIIILVGTLAGHKNAILQRLVAEEKDIKLIVNHTTRPRSLTEVEGQHYYFISSAEFDKILQAGEFLTVLESFGNMYGLHRDEIVKASMSNQSVFITHCDMMNAILMRDYGYMPMILLAIPKCEETHREWIKLQYMEDYLVGYYKSAVGKKICRVSPGTLIEVSDIMHSIFEKVLICNPNGAKNDSKRDDYSSKESYCSSSDSANNSKTMSTDLSSHSNLETPCSIDDANDTTEKSCLRKLDIKPFGTAQRQTVTFGETVEENDVVSLIMLGYDSEASIMFNSAREMLDQEEMHEEFLHEQTGKNKSSNQSTQDPQQQYVEYISNILPTNKGMDIFIESIIKTRNLYLDYHTENPGLFADIIYTDEPDISIMRLKKIAATMKEPKPIPDIYSYLELGNNARMLNEKKNEISRALQHSRSAQACQEMEVAKYVDIKVFNSRYTEE